MGYSILPLSPDTVLARVNELKSILKQVDYQYWEYKHFIKDLPGKWEYSFYATDNVSNQILGFIVCSVKDHRILHEHKLFITKSMHRLGMGSRLLLSSVRQGIKNGLKEYSLNVYRESIPAIKLYQSLGMQIIDEVEDEIGIRYYMAGTLQSIKIELERRLSQ